MSLLDLPHLHPSLTLHLSDNASTPILSSASPARTTRSSALASLNRSALASHTAATRFGLGSPVRLILECAPADPDPADIPDETHHTTTTSGPMVLTTFIPPLSPPTPPPPHPESDPNGDSSSLPQPGQSSTTRQPGTAPGADSDGEGTTHRPPLLVAIVVAPDGDSTTVADARLASSRLARVGRRVQAQWADGADGAEDGDA